MEHRAVSIAITTNSHDIVQRPQSLLMNGYEYENGVVYRFVRKTAVAKCKTLGGEEEFSSVLTFYICSNHGRIFFLYESKTRSK